MGGRKGRGRVGGIRMVHVMVMILMPMLSPIMVMLQMHSHEIEANDHWHVQDPTQLID
jgi:hypothetical protein